MKIKLRDVRQIIVSEVRRLLEASKRCRCSEPGCFHAGYDCHNRSGGAVDANGEPLCDACADTQQSSHAEETTPSSDWQCLDCGRWFSNLKMFRGHVEKHYPPGVKKPVKLKETIGLYSKKK